jgi:putative ubiquitin-RnfH superfamily antitoxin RatB of RatAB toxin-antitoxin module
MADKAARIVVDIVYAEPHGAIVKTLSLRQGARVQDALHEAAKDAQLTRIVLAGSTLGIHGRVVSHDQVLSDGDRIEIYRPLVEDPKSARRKRARSTGDAPRDT